MSLVGNLCRVMAVSTVILVVLFAVGMAVSLAMRFTIQ